MNLYFKIIKNKVQLIYLIKSFHKKKKKSSYQYKNIKKELHIIKYFRL